MNADSSDVKVCATHSPPIAHIELNRPTKLNALDLDCLNQLEQHIVDAEKDDDIRVVLLSGRGRCFCAGADLGVVDAAIADSRFDAFLRRWHEVFGRLERCSKPTIAAVHGMALAGGFELMQVCDVVVIGDTTTVGDQHAKFGLFPGGGSTQRLPRLVGRRAATWMLLSGEAISPESAVALGLANEVVPEAEVVSRARGLAEGLAERSVAASQAIKEALLRTGDLDLAAGIEVELEIAVAHMSSPDAARGLAAFRSRSTPDFGYTRPAAG
jgi:enoyl-CoA hydratase/carnithine racemase